MRFPFILVTCALTAIANADRLITIPTGRKLPWRTVRMETLSEVSRGRTQLYYFGYGLSPYLEIDARSEYFQGTNAQGTFDLAYNYISPVPDITPGFSVGVQDVLDNTRDGRRYYVATTLRPIFQTVNGDVPADFTLGGFFGRKPAPFVGGTLPFSREFRLLYEYNGIRISFGGEIRATDDLSVRLIYREQDVLAGLQYSHRF